jgi:hypothetical protein
LAKLTSIKSKGYKASFALKEVFAGESNLILLQKPLKRSNPLKILRKIAKKR